MHAWPSDPRAASVYGLRVATLRVKRRVLELVAAGGVSVRERMVDTQIVFREDATGMSVQEYRVQISGTHDLSVRMPALLGRAQAAEVADHLRSLAYDLSVDAGLQDYEASARAELLAACQVVREECELSTLEKVRAKMTEFMFFVGAVESFLKCTLR
jgi:hypothetical protein